MGSFDMIPEIVNLFKPEEIIKWCTKFFWIVFRDPFVAWVNSPGWFKLCVKLVLLILSLFFIWFLWTKRYAWQHVRP